MSVASRCIAAFFVAGIPASMPRPVAKRVGNFARVVSNRSNHPSMSWKESVRQYALTAMAGRPKHEEGPVRLELLFQMQRPESLKKKSNINDFILVTKGKDVDNLAKCVMDALNEIVWEDDRLVSTLIVRKQYTMPNQRAGVQVGIFHDEPEQLPFFP